MTTRYSSYAPSSSTSYRPSSYSFSKAGPSTSNLSFRSGKISLAALDKANFKDYIKKDLPKKVRFAGSFTPTTVAQKTTDEKIPLAQADEFKTKFVNSVIVHLGSNPGSPQPFDQVEILAMGYVNTKSGSSFNSLTAMENALMLAQGPKYMLAHSSISELFKEVLGLTDVAFTWMVNAIRFVPCDLVDFPSVLPPSITLSIATTDPTLYQALQKKSDAFRGYFGDKGFSLVLSCEKKMPPAEVERCVRPYNFLKKYLVSSPHELTRNTLSLLYEIQEAQAAGYNASLKMYLSNSCGGEQWNACEMQYKLTKFDVTTEYMSFLSAACFRHFVTWLGSSKSKQLDKADIEKSWTQAFVGTGTTVDVRDENPKPVELWSYSAEVKEFCEDIQELFKVMLDELKEDACDTVRADVTCRYLAPINYVLDYIRDIKKTDWNLHHNDVLQGTLLGVVHFILSLDNELQLAKQGKSQFIKVPLLIKEGGFQMAVGPIKAYVDRFYDYFQKAMLYITQRFDDVDCMYWTVRFLKSDDSTALCKKVAHGYLPQSLLVTILVLRKSVIDIPEIRSAFYDGSGEPVMYPDMSKLMSFLHNDKHHPKHQAVSAFVAVYQSVLNDAKIKEVGGYNRYVDKLYRETCKLVSRGRKDGYLGPSSDQDLDTLKLILTNFGQAVARVAHPYLNGFLEKENQVMKLGRMDRNAKALWHLHQACRLLGTNIEEEGNDTFLKMITKSQGHPAFMQYLGALKSIYDDRTPQELVAGVKSAMCPLADKVLAPVVATVQDAFWTPSLFAGGTGRISELDIYDNAVGPDAQVYFRAYDHNDPSRPMHVQAGSVYPSESPLLGRSDAPTL